MDPDFRSWPKCLQTLDTRQSTDNGLVLIGAAVATGDGAGAANKSGTESVG